jgi:hypothetical protein
MHNAGCGVNKSSGFGHEFGGALIDDYPALNAVMIRC